MDDSQYHKQRDFISVQVYLFTAETMTLILALQNKISKQYLKYNHEDFFNTLQHSKVSHSMLNYKQIDPGVSLRTGRWAN